MVVVAIHVLELIVWLIFVVNIVNSYFEPTIVIERYQFLTGCQNQICCI